MGVGASLPHHDSKAQNTVYGENGVSIYIYMYIYVHTYILYIYIYNVVP